MLATIRDFSAAVSNSFSTRQATAWSRSKLLCSLTPLLLVKGNRRSTGSQGSLRVLDPEHVDERRQKVGLGPLQAHLAQLQRWLRNSDGSARRLAVIHGAWVEVPHDYDPAGVDGAGQLS